MKQLLYDEKGICIGALAENGQAHLADLVIVCTGANTAALVDAKNEIVARSHCVGVIQLTSEEAERYKNLPIVDDFEQGKCSYRCIAACRVTANSCGVPGILFPPDENGLLKLCSCRFITNYYTSHVRGASLGHSFGDHPEDGVPRVIEEEMRSFVRDMIPELANRPWASTRMCW